MYRMTPKAQSMKAIIKKLDFIKKTFALQKAMLRE